jgi:hypothetical protein
MTLEIDIRFVKKDVIALFGFDESVPFFFTEPFDYALSHQKCLLSRRYQCTDFRRSSWEPIDSIEKTGVKIGGQIESQNNSQ